MAPTSDPVLFGHCRHTFSSPPDPYVPGLHWAHPSCCVVAPVTTPLDPAGQVSHLVKPDAGWYDPLAHCVQLEDPSAAEKFPAGQSEHEVPDWAPARGEYLPCTQDWQVASELCPVLPEYFPATQSVHCVELVYPVPTPYFPFPHAEHAEA